LSALSSDSTIQSVALPSPSPTPSPTPTATATVTATPTATSTATATPAATAAQAVNLSTRMRVDTGDKAGIGGFIITGSGQKRVLIRAIGPSLTRSGVSGVLADPTLELYHSGPDSIS